LVVENVGGLQKLRKNHQVGQFQLFNAAAPELKVGKQENILFL